MKFIVKDMDIATGDVQVAILNEKDARLLDLHHNDRIVLKRGKLSTVAILDVAESEKAVPVGSIGFFEETLKALAAKEGDTVELAIAEKPKSLVNIKAKLDGFELTQSEIAEIVKDIVGNKLSTAELSSFVLAGYTRGLSTAEIASLTKSMAATGSQLKFKGKVADIHSTGGVPGNRCTLLVVPILAAAGLQVPKTSSRAITSPAGTADTMEVLAPVALPIPKLYRIISEVGAFIVWGGAIALAPADDRIIRIEFSLGIDALGQMIASIMAKKAAVSATHVLIEIPYGPGCKTYTLKDALYVQRLFESVGQGLGIGVRCWPIPGDQPVGNGLGAVLEARDCLWALRCDERAPKDLLQKSLTMAGLELEFIRKSKPGKGMQTAKQLLESGAAWEKMKEIIKAQGGRVVSPDKLQIAKYSQDVCAPFSGKVRAIDNIAISKIARLAGCPKDAEAGLYLYKHVGDRVEKGECLFTIYAKSQQKLHFALEGWRSFGGFEIKRD